jgi:hypothetical protein
MKPKFMLRSSGLLPDCQPWVPVARRVQAGVYDRADGSTLKSVIIGLRGIPHSVCVQAVDRLKKLSAIGPRSVTLAGPRLL